MFCSTMCVILGTYLPTSYSFLQKQSGEWKTESLTQFSQLRNDIDVFLVLTFQHYYYHHPYLTVNDGHRTFLQFLGFCLIIINEWNCQKWMRKFLDCHEKWGTSALRSVHNFSNKSTCLYCVTLNFTTELLWRPTHPLITLCAKKLLCTFVHHWFEN